MTKKEDNKTTTRGRRYVLADHIKTDPTPFTEWGSDRLRKSSRDPSLELLDPRHPHHLYTRYGTSDQAHGR
jgi:hypothetical protein